MRSRRVVLALKVCAVVAIAMGVVLVLSSGSEAAPTSEVKKLLASDAQAADYFGRSVAVSGDTAVVGAVAEDAGGDYAGAAYVFGRDQGGANNWGEVKKLIASDAQAGDSFGRLLGGGGD